MSVYFKDVCAADDQDWQSVVRTPNFFYILNTDRKHLGGTHWVSIFNREGERMFFDSYGKMPSTYDPLWRPFDHFTKNNQDYQSETTDVCGDWCLYFGRKMSMGHDFKNLFKCFISGDPRNDSMIENLLHSEYPNLQRNYDHDLPEVSSRSLSFQGCKARKSVM